MEGTSLGLLLQNPSLKNALALGAELDVPKGPVVLQQ